MIIDQKIAGFMLLQGTNVFSFDEKYNVLAELKMNGRTNKIYLNPQTGKKIEVFIEGEKINSIDSALLYYPINSFKDQQDRFNVFELNIHNNSQEITIINGSTDEIYVEFLLLTVDSAQNPAPLQKCISVPVFNAKVLQTTTLRTTIDLKEFNRINSFALYSLYTTLGSSQFGVFMSMTIGNFKQMHRTLVDGLICQGRYQKLEHIPIDIDLKHYKFADIEITANYTGVPILILLKGN